MFHLLSNLPNLPLNLLPSLSMSFIAVSSLLALISPLVYVRAIVRGEAKPNRMTRLILLVTALLATAALFAQRDTVAIWLAVIALIQSIGIFGLSLKLGMGGWSKLDLVCLGVALVGIVIWQTTHNPLLALYASIMADFIGMVPALLKTYYFPKTEIWQFYFLDTIAATFSLLAIQTWSVQTLAYPLYILMINLGMVLLITVRGAAWARQALSLKKLL